MIDPVLFTAFLTTTFFFLIVPGPSVAFATAQAVRHGRRAAFVAVAGDALGTIVHIAVAIAGLTALAALSELILPFLQIAGGAFILGMAWQALRSSGKPSTAVKPSSDQVTFWAGFFACVTNPKAIVFFIALFPAFIAPDKSLLAQGVIYGMIFIVLDATSILAYALAANAAARRVASRWLDTNLLSALGLFGVGVAMIIKGYRELPSH